MVVWANLLGLLNPHRYVWHNATGISSTRAWVFFDQNRRLVDGSWGFTPRRMSWIVQISNGPLVSDYTNFLLRSSSAIRWYRTYVRTSWIAARILQDRSIFLQVFWLENDCLPRIWSTSIRIFNFLACQARPSYRHNSIIHQNWCLRIISVDSPWSLNIT